MRHCNWHYLYGHHCTVFTNHEALKSLLNIPQPSGKLARWGMALQETDLKLEFHPEKTNGRADALSRYPIPLLSLDCNKMHTSALFANVVGVGSDAESGDEKTLSERQQDDTGLAAVIDYLRKGVLPKEDKAARELFVGASQYTLIYGILYHVENDNTLHIITPTPDRHRLFLEVHKGLFSGHLREAKVVNQLFRHYWWPGLRRNIHQWCRACPTCAHRFIGRPTKPLLTPIPVDGRSTELEWTS